jgi:peptide/nickel transport system substrate-binding protein
MAQKLSISRRELVGGVLGTGLIATAGGILLSKSGSHPAKPRAMIGLGEKEPRYGGRIRVSSMASSTADTLDPAKGALSTDYVRHNMFYNGLTRYDRFLNAQPELAETIESSDQQLWRVKLRKGVVFHDGKPLTSADVVYSLLRHKVPTIASKVKAIADQFADVRADGSDEVLIRLTGPNVDLPALLAQSQFLIIRNGTSQFHTANGTGPFRCAEFRPGERTIGVRNPDYWKHGRPFLDAVELIGIPDEVSRVNALLSGDVHLINSVSPLSTRRINDTPGYEVMATPSGLYTDLIMQQTTLPTGNPHFTLAMKYLFDRELIRRAVFGNYATIGNDQPIPPTNRYFNPEIPQRSYDPDRAKYHVRMAGLTGARLPMFASPAAEGSVDMASVLQEYGAKVGLSLAVNRVPADGYWSAHWMKHPLSFGNTNPRPTADLLFSLCYKSDAAWNESHWNNPTFDRLLVEARGEPDEQRRKTLYGEMQQLVHDQCGVAIPAFISLIDGHDVRLRGLYPIPIGGLMGYLFADQVWWDA